MHSRLLVILLCLSSTLFAANDVTVKLDIKAYNGEKLNRPFLVVYENLLPIDTIDIWNSGTERFKLELNKEYILEVRQECYAPTMISLSTIVPEGVKNGGSVKVPITIYPFLDGVSYSLLQIPLKHFAYNFVLDKFDEYKPYAKGLSADADVFLSQMKNKIQGKSVVNKKKGSYIGDTDCKRLLRQRDLKVKLIHAQLIAKRIDYVGEIDSSYYAQFITEEKRKERGVVDLAKIEHEALKRKQQKNAIDPVIEKVVTQVNTENPIDIIKAQLESNEEQNITAQDVIASEAIIVQQKAKISTLNEYNEILKEEAEAIQKYYEDVINQVSKKRRLIEEIAETKREQKRLNSDY